MKAFHSVRCAVHVAVATALIIVGLSEAGLDQAHAQAAKANRSPQSGNIASKNGAASVSRESIGDQVAALDERLIDLQVQVATLRSLAAGATPVAVEGDRIAALENEMSAIVSKSRELSGRPTSIQAEATTALTPRPDQSVALPGGAMPTVPNSPGNQMTSSGLSTGQASGWSGSTTVTPNVGQQGSDPAPRPFGTPQQGSYGGQPNQTGELLPGTVYGGTAAPGQVVPGGRAPSGNVVAGWQKPGSSAPQPSANNAPPLSDAETEYQTAYSYLLQQDYGAARTAFEEFLARHPNTPLAGNAQYWIGETHYASGSYKEAAVAFLKAYEKYGNGSKGPDSLLKLAMSLGKLRQTPAACSSLREVGNRYRSGPQDILQRARSEMQRLRCPQ